MLSLFAVTAPGVEKICAEELRQLGLFDENTSGFAIDAGGVSFQGELSAIYRANLHLRTANRVLLRLGDFYAVAFPELRKRASRLDWGRYLVAGQTVAIRVTCHKSKLYHSEAVAERIAGAIEDCLGSSVNRQKPGDEEAENPPQLIVVRLANDHCTISVDTSGELLHRRGYRQALGKAPLRETLAAAMILASGWDGKSPLIDPFCGSGSIPIEAALIALGLAPGRNREFAFMKWPRYDAKLWTTLLASSSPTAGVDMPPIFASDRDAGVIRMAHENAERAGVAEYVQFACQAVSAMTPPETVGSVVTNPPYGVRISENKDVRNLYAQFGKVLRQKCAGWSATILCNDVKLLNQTALKLDTSLKFSNGGINVIVARGKVA